MTLLDKLIQKANLLQGLHYRNPPVPCVCGFPGGLNIGSKIYIRGIVAIDSTRFSINLQRGAHEETADIYFHLNPRFPTDAGRIVVRNARYHDEWGKEETDGESPFVPGKSFFMVITAYSNNYEVEINGDLFCTFSHRENLNVSNVTHFSIDGGVIIQSFHLPVETMPKHLRIAIPGNAKIGDVYSIKGNVNHGAESWVANIQCGPGKHDDVIYHFNPRFQDTQKIIRNSRSDESWGIEEKDGKMPFKEGEEFLLQIAVALVDFRTRINKNSFAPFEHRLDLTSASVLFIEGDVTIQDVWIDCTANQIQSDGVKEDITKILKKSKYQFYFPEFPIVSRLTSALSVGQVVCVSGTIAKNPERFAVNLQCDSCDSADIGLHYNPRWSNGDDVVIVNSRQDDQWDEEVRVKEKFPFSADNHFEIMIICQKDNYVIVVNGIQNCVYPHRLEISRIDHINIEGSVDIDRILIA